MLSNDVLETSIMAIAIDGSDKGLKTSLRSMNWLTKGRAVQLGSLEVNITRADISECGFPPDPDTVEPGTAVSREDL
jgi:hypothetical protein